MKERKELRAFTCCARLHHCLEHDGLVYSWAFLLIIVFLSLSCGYTERTGKHTSKGIEPDGNEAAPEYPLDEEDYRVYSAILKNEITRDSIDKIVIANHTFRETFDREGILRHGETGRSFLQNLSSQIIEDFDRKNKSEYLLSRQFPPVGNFDLILFDERSFFSQQNVTRAHGEWLSFFERFPHSQGLFTFSRVGFDENSNKALVSISNSAGVNDAAGALVYLEKRQDKWALVRSLQLWVT